MPNKIKPKRSYTAGAVPTTSDLDTHEIAFNWADFKAFVKDGSGNILSVTMGGGGSGSDTLLRSLFVPAAPTGVTASAGNAHATVTWTAPTGTISQAPVTDYVVQFSSNSGSSWATFSDGTSTAASAVVPGLTNGTAYTFRVAAVNSIGQGSWSSASTAVTPAAGDIIQTTAGLYARYDASSANSLYSAQSGGSVVTSDGGLVYRFEDSSGNNRHLRTYSDNSTVAPRLSVSVRNGKNGILFDNANRSDILKTAANRESGSFNTGNPLTIFAVVYSNAGNTYLLEDLRYSWGDREGGTLTTLGLYNGGLYLQQSGVNWTGTTSRSGQWMVVRATLNGTSSTLAVNGVTETPGGGFSTGGSTVSNYNFANACGDFFLTGTYTLGELVFVSSAISGSTASGIESFLMTKWGIEPPPASKLTVTRRNGSPSTFTGSGTAADPFTRAARVLGSNADGLGSQSNGTAGSAGGAYAFTATASGTAYVTFTFYDDDNDGWTGAVLKNGAGQGNSLSDGQTVTARSFAVSAGDVITFYAGNTNTSFANVSVWVV